MARRPTLQVVGERNSGTTYLYHMFEASLDADVLVATDPAWFSKASQRLPHGPRELATDAWFGATRTVWKHGLLDARNMRRLQRRNVFAVGVTKHPLAWMLSMHRRPYHRGELHADFVEFATTPWKTVGRERLQRRTMPNGFAIWAEKAEAVATLRDRGAIKLWRYEDVLLDEMGHLTELADWIGAPRPTAVRGVASSTKQQVAGDDRSHADISEYYRLEQWREQIPAAVVDAARGTCADAAHRLGYEL